MGIVEAMSSGMGTVRGPAAADRLCELCVDLLAVDAAAISLVLDDASTGTWGASSGSARRWDELQFTVGEGPCLSSVVDRLPVLVPDLADAADRRWPVYAPAILDQGVCAVYAVPVTLAGQFVGALDLYRRATGSLAGDHLDGAFAAAALATAPLLDLLGVDRHEAAADPDSSAWQELNTLTRVEVSQATGVLVSQLDVDPAEALVRLRAHAFATGRTATDVAHDILAGRLRLEA